MAINRGVAQDSEETLNFAVLNFAVLNFAVLKNIRPIIESYPLEQAEDA